MKLSLCSCRVGTLCAYPFLFKIKITSNILPFFLNACQILVIYSLSTLCILPNEYEQWTMYPRGCRSVPLGLPYFPSSGFSCWRPPAPNTRYYSIDTRYVLDRYSIPTRLIVPFISLCSYLGVIKPRFNHSAVLIWFRGIIVARVVTDTALRFGSHNVLTFEHVRTFLALFRPYLSFFSYAMIETCLYSQV